eukprot:EG_transcript_21138
MTFGGLQLWPNPNFMPNLRCVPPIFLPKNVQSLSEIAHFWWKKMLYPLISQLFFPNFKWADVMTPAPRHPYCQSHASLSESWDTMSHFHCFFWVSDAGVVTFNKMSICANVHIDTEQKFKCKLSFLIVQ